MIITIGREFGSGGREFGRRLAEELGIAYYDREILAEIAKKTAYSQEYIEEVSQGRPVALFPIHYGGSFLSVADPNITQAADIFQEQSNVLKELADKSDCLIIGRAADYVLRDRHPFRIFIYSSLEAKVRRCKEREDEREKGLSDKALIKRIKQVDKKRRQYYEFYTGNVWGDRNHYDLLINTSNGDLKALAKAVAALLKPKK